MMKPKAIGVIIAILLLYVFSIILVLLGPPAVNLFDLLERLFAIIGIITLFIASMMTPFQRQLYKIFDQSFTKIHHFFSISGLVIITLHPIIIAINSIDLTVFLPDFQNFWATAGRPSLVIFYITFATALFRNKSVLPKYWKYIHWFNYLALTLGVIHANLIGTDVMTSFPLFLLLNILLVISWAVLLYKRYEAYQRKQRLLKRKEKRETDS